MESYPYLSDLLGGYFHQDAYDDDATHESIMQTFRESSWDYQRLGVRADIKRFIHQHADNLLTDFKETFEPDIIVGESNEDTRAWLMKIESLAG
jgi:hypothetical protein